VQHPHGKQPQKPIDFRPTYQLLEAQIFRSMYWCIVWLPAGDRACEGTTIGKLSRMKGGGMNFGVRRFLLPMALLVTPTASCSAGGADEANASQDQAKDTAKAPAQPAKAPNSAGTDGADDRPVRRETELDRNSLQMAEGACRSQDFKTFLRAFSASWLVREKYTAARVQFGSVGRSRPMYARQYLDQNNFPFAPMDNSYVTAESAMLFDMDPDAGWRKLAFVELEFNTSSDNRQRVDWVTGLFERNLDPPPDDLEEGLGKLIQPEASGYVLFEPSNECWLLTQDIVNPREET
jgi:hypothetical protein